MNKKIIPIFTFILFLLFFSWSTFKAFYSIITDRATDKNTISFWCTLKGKPESIGGGGSASRIYGFELKEYPDFVFIVELYFRNEFPKISEPGDSVFVSIPLKYFSKLKGKEKSKIFDDYLWGRDSNTILVYAVSAKDTSYWTIDNYNKDLLWRRILPGIVYLVLIVGTVYLLFKLGIKHDT